LLRDWGVSSYAGRCAARGVANASGETPAELAASATGAATFDLQAGVISGINFEEALRRSQRRTIEVARDMVSGQTRFSSATARIAIAGGEARIEDARAQGPGAIVEATGTIGLITRDWRVKLLATQATELGRPSPDAPRLGFALSGSWMAPLLTATGDD
jgi:AsmA protein